MIDQKQRKGVLACKQPPACSLCSGGAHIQSGLVPSVEKPLIDTSSLLGGSKSNHD